MPKQNFNFEMIDIPVGAVLTFKDQENIICKVSNQNPPRVNYEGEIIRLTPAAKKARGSDGSINGTKWWKYEGELLWDRRERMEFMEKEIEYIDWLEVSKEFSDVIASDPENPDGERIVEQSRRSEFVINLNSE